MVDLKFHLADFVSLIASLNKICSYNLLTSNKRQIYLQKLLHKFCLGGGRLLLGSSFDLCMDNEELI